MSLSTDHLRAAAAQRRRAILERAQRALRELDGDGTPITFQAVARRAGISRQWLYKQPDLRAEIERLRDRRTPAGIAPVPEAERAREASLRQRNTALLAENRRLREENAALRDELASLYGERRSAGARRADRPRPAGGARSARRSRQSRARVGPRSAGRLPSGVLIPTTTGDRD